MAAGCERGSRDAPGRTRPNVVVITVDTLRADRLGCYGFERARTPHIDKLAAEGVLAKHVIAPTPITLPSHTSIFTGLQPPAHGVRNNAAFLVPDEAVTLAERLKAEGYRTQAFVSAMVLHRMYNLNRGFDGYDDRLWGEEQAELFLNRERSGARTTDLVLEWLDKATASSKDVPFFLWVHVPLIVRYPRKLPAGKIYPGPARLVDIMPTILGLLGVEPSLSQGADLSAPFAGTTPPPTFAQYSESLHPELEYGMAPLYGLRLDQWTYIQAPRPELYARAKDPGETRNLLEPSAAASDPAGASAAAAQTMKLDHELSKTLGELERLALAPKAKPLDKDPADMLRALGYVADAEAKQGLEGMDSKDGLQVCAQIQNARQLRHKGDYAACTRVLEPLLKGHAQERAGAQHSGALRNRTTARQRKPMRKPPRSSREAFMHGSTAASARFGWERSRPPNST